jgi:hypothetical protein
VKILIEPTGHFFMAGDVMVRLWQGETAEGEPVIALLTAVVFTGEVRSVTEGLGLVSIPPPTEDEARLWAAKILAG